MKRDQTGTDCRRRETRHDQEKFFFWCILPKVRPYFAVVCEHDNQDKSASTSKPAGR